MSQSYPANPATEETKEHKPTTYTILANAYARITAIPKGDQDLYMLIQKRALLDEYESYRMIGKLIKAIAMPIKVQEFYRFIAPPPLPPVAKAYQVYADAVKMHFKDPDHFPMPAPFTLPKPQEGHWELVIETDSRMQDHALELLRLRWMDNPLMTAQKIVEMLADWPIYRTNDDKYRSPGDDNQYRIEVIKPILRQAQRLLLTQIPAAPDWEAIDKAAKEQKKPSSKRPEMRQVPMMPKGGQPVLRQHPQQSHAAGNGIRPLPETPDLRLRRRRRRQAGRTQPAAGQRLRPPAQHEPQPLQRRQVQPSLRRAAPRRGRRQQPHPALTPLPRPPGRRRPQGEDRHRQAAPPMATWWYRPSPPWCPPKQAQAAQGQPPRPGAAALTTWTTGTTSTSTTARPATSGQSPNHRDSATAKLRKPVTLGSAPHGPIPQAKVPDLPTRPSPRKMRPTSSGGISTGCPARYMAYLVYSVRRFYDRNGIKKHVVIYQPVKIIKRRSEEADKDSCASKKAAWADRRRRRPAPALPRRPADCPVRLGRQHHRLQQLPPGSPNLPGELPEKFTTPLTAEEIKTLGRENIKPIRAVRPHVG